MSRLKIYLLPTLLLNILEHSGCRLPIYTHSGCTNLSRKLPPFVQDNPIDRSEWLKFSSKYSEFTYYTYFETPFRRGFWSLDANYHFKKKTSRISVVVQGGEDFEVYRRLLSSSGSHGRMMARLARMISIRETVWSDDRRLRRCGEKSFYKFHSVAFPFWRWVVPPPPPLLPLPFSGGPAHFPASVTPFRSQSTAYSPDLLHSVFRYRVQFRRSRYLAGDKRRSGI